VRFCLFTPFVFDVYFFFFFFFFAINTQFERSNRNTSYRPNTNTTDDRVLSLMITCMKSIVIIYRTRKHFSPVDFCPCVRKVVHH